MPLKIKIYVTGFQYETRIYCVADLEIRPYKFVRVLAPSWIQTWDLTVCLYLNLKHGTETGFIAMSIIARFVK